MDEIRAQVNSLNDELIQARRWLHQHAELSFQEAQTSAYIEKWLHSLGDGLEISRPAGNSVLAVLKTGRPGPVIGFRADMDALPMTEEHPFPYKSENPGVMHSCGHDGHTAIQLCAAKLLLGMKDQLCGEIRFFFQHAEEVPPGGAVEMVNAGAADGLEEIYGMHLSSNYPTGSFGIRYGALTSATDRFDAVILGKGGHSSMPELCVDPIVIGSQFIVNLQTVVSRNISAVDPAVVSTCMVNSGSAYNIIPEEMKITGSVRTFDPNTRAEMPKMIERILSGTAAAGGASYQFNYSLGYASVFNDEKLTKNVEEVITSSFGEDHILKIDLLMPGEDFSAFLTKCPGCFVEVGARSEEKGITAPHHNPAYLMDEDALPGAVELFVRIALSRVKLP